MAWRSLQWDNFYRCLLWSSSLCSLLTFKDRHIHCWSKRIQVTSWDVCDHEKHLNALHLFLNWKLTWTTMLYLPTSCSKGSFSLFLLFFFEHWKSWRVSCTFLHFQVCVSAPSTCPFLSLSRAPGLLLSFFWHPGSSGKHLSRLGSCLTLWASFNMILDLPFVAYYSLIHWERAVFQFNKPQILAALLC